MLTKTVDWPVNGRATQRISNACLMLLLGENFDVFPHGTEFRVYEGHIPVALIPTPTGGAVCLAFDTQTPRGFPIGSFTKSDAISYPEFQQLQEISRI